MGVKESHVAYNHLEDEYDTNHENEINNKKRKLSLILILAEESMAIAFLIAMLMMMK
ncbi:hypothetical protein BH11BAC2_BH11BAC2_23060 [soil metagenome]